MTAAATGNKGGHAMPNTPFYCSTNSGHEHSTAWEAQNCSELFAVLRVVVDEVIDYLETGEPMDVDNLFDVLTPFEIR
jgi:hypothetical protein